MLCGCPYLEHRCIHNLYFAPLPLVVLGLRCQLGLPLDARLALLLVRTLLDGRAQPLADAQRGQVRQLRPDPLRLLPLPQLLPKVLLLLQVRPPRLVHGFPRLADATPGHPSGSVGVPGEVDGGGVVALAVLAVLAVPLAWRGAARLVELQHGAQRVHGGDPVGLLGLEVGQHEPEHGVDAPLGGHDPDARAGGQRDLGLVVKVQAEEDVAGGPGSVERHGPEDRVDALLHVEEVVGRGTTGGRSVAAARVCGVCGEDGLAHDGGLRPAVRGPPPEEPHRQAPQRVADGEGLGRRVPPAPQLPPLLVAAEGPRAEVRQGQRPPRGQLGAGPDHEGRRARVPAARRA